MPFLGRRNRVPKIQSFDRLLMQAQGITELIIIPLLIHKRRLLGLALPRKDCVIMYTAKLLDGTQLHYIEMVNADNTPLARETLEKVGRSIGLQDISKVDKVVDFLNFTRTLRNILTAFDRAKQANRQIPGLKVTLCNNDGEMSQAEMDHIHEMAEKYELKAF